VSLLYSCWLLGDSTFAGYVKEVCTRPSQEKAAKSIDEADDDEVREPTFAMEDLPRSGSPWRSCTTVVPLDFSNQNAGYEQDDREQARQLSDIVAGGLEGMNLMHDAVACQSVPFAMYPIQNLKLR
jgi:hypothetical protein